LSSIFLFLRILSGPVYTFENGVHRLPVEGRPHPDEEELLRPFRKVVDQQLRVGRDGLDGLVDRLPPDLGGDEVDGGVEGVGHPDESHPVAVAHPPRSVSRNLVVAAEAVADLKEIGKPLIVAVQ
jgi:hypothetical protein